MERGCPEKGQPLLFVVQVHLDGFRGSDERRLFELLCEPIEGEQRVSAGQRGPESLTEVPPK